MQDKLQESLKFLELAKENSDLRSAAEELRKEKKKIEDRLMAVYFILFFVALFLGVGCYLANDGYKDSQETISSLESDMEELQSEYNDLEDAAYFMDEYIDFLEAELDAYGYWEEDVVEDYTEYTSENQTITVYVTNTGEKYHKDGCQYLSQSKNPISLEDAEKYGYEPCSQCY